MLVVLAAVVVALVVARLGSPLPTATAVLRPPPVLASASGHAGGARGTRMVVPGAAAPLPWPAQGEGAVAVPAAGLTLTSPSQQPVPVASLTKIMTAYVILRDHPLGPTEPGPSVTMTASDEASAAHDAQINATSVPVVAGERLTERQLLDGLLVHSANDYADALARWDAGTIGAFVAKMNTTAAALGMTHTHFADASGIDPGSTSTAADLLKVTAAAMALPTFAVVVDQRTVVLPRAGLLTNYVQAIGTDGVVGVKSGFTEAAQGCVVLAAHRQVGSQQVLVLAAVTGQSGYGALFKADAAAEKLIDAAAGGLRHQTVVTAGARWAQIPVPWAAAPVPATATRRATLLVWPGDTVDVRLAARPLAVGSPPGTVIGTLTVADGGEQVTVPLRSTAPLQGPTLGWHLLHG